MLLEIYIPLIFIILFLGMFISIKNNKPEVYLITYFIVIIMCVHAIVAIELSRTIKNKYEEIDSGERYKIILVKSKKVKSLGLIVHFNEFITYVKK